VGYFTIRDFQIGNWRELQSNNIEFTMKRLREPIDGGANGRQLAIRQLRRALLLLLGMKHRLLRPQICDQ
jgi:hypothetical protein